MTESSRYSDDDDTSGGLSRWRTVAARTVIGNEISPLHLQCTDHGREEDGEVMMMKGLIWVKNVREYVWICKKKFRHENKPNQRHLRLPLIF